MTAVVEYLTPSDAALILQCSAQAVRDAADAGKLPISARTAGQNSIRLFLPSDVEKFRRERSKARR